MTTERQLLEDFVVDNRDLEELEAQLAQFPASVGAHARY